MNVLVMGATGFVGSHLVEYVLANHKDAKVFGIKRWRSKTENIVHLEDKVKLFECDIKDAASVHELLEQVKPDKIFHLAAQSFVPASWSAPSETLVTNIIGEVNILEAMRQLRLPCFIQVAGSSEEYGLVKEDELPIREENPLRPLSPYGVSKVGQDLLGYQYYMNYKLNIIRTRAFNHSGPRRGNVFVESDFARQIALIEKKKQTPEIHVGNLEAKRDYLDVRDVVRAYWLSLEKGVPGEVYNICSGESHTIKKVLDVLLSLSTIKAKIVVDKDRLRPTDVPVLEGNCDRFKKQTGWKPTIALEDTLKDLLTYWRQRS